MVRYLDLRHFLDSYPSKIGNKEIYVNTKTSKRIPEKNQIWLECFAADKAKIEKFIQFEIDAANCIGNYESIFDKDYHRNWVNLEDFI